MVTPPPQEFCVRWNSYQTNLQTAFPKLLNSEHFVDVTLACENEMLKCHKVVLSACSTYFEKLLLGNPCHHPIILMKDMKFQEMQCLVDFMYKGEVNVSQDLLPSLLKSAEALQIRGLSGSDQLFNMQQFGFNKTPQAKMGQQQQLQQQQHQQQQQQQHQQQQQQVNANTENKAHTESTFIRVAPDVGSAIVNKKEDKAEGSESGNNPSSSECDSNDGVQPKDETELKEEIVEEDSYYDGENDLMMDTEFIEEDTSINITTSDLNKTPDFAIANVSCHYDGSSGSATNKRIRRSDEELRRAAECITRGQTFQTVSDLFNIPISTIRFYMARKGILPRRKRGRACSGPSSGGMAMSSYNHPPGNTSPIGPPFQFAQYKLPAMGLSKLK